MDNANAANIAALLESNHENLPNYTCIDDGNDSAALDIPGLEGFTVVCTGTFQNQSYIKAIAVEDRSGNLFVHFFGTGDGNWEYNAAAYGALPQPSDMQKWALDYFDKVVEQHYADNPSGNLYVTGHSQGGNNAQFVTIRSEYGDSIKNCISLDGPGFSHRFVEDSESLPNYESQRNKIWAYNGENDYVSILGQESIVPNGHTRYIEYTGQGLDFMLFHDGGGLLDEDGKISLVFGDTKFREFLIDALDKVKDLPLDRQARAAELTMKLFEDLLGSGSGMTAQDFNELKWMLFPLILDVLADTGKIADVLAEFGMERSTAGAISNLLDEFGRYPPEAREQMLRSLLDAISYKGGQIKIDLLKAPGSILSIVGSMLSDFWDRQKEKINNIGKAPTGDLPRVDILIDEDAFIKASKDLAALSGRIDTLRNEIAAMLDTLKKGFDTPAGRKFYNSCNAVLLKPLDDQKLVLDHISQVLLTSKTQYQSVFDAYNDLNNSILNYSG